MVYFFPFNIPTPLLPSSLLPFNVYLGEESVVAFSSLRRLSHLDIAYNRLGNEGLAKVAFHFPRLVYMDVSVNEISELPEAVVHLHNLTVLDARRNQIQDDSVRGLTVLQNLTSLNLLENPISRCTATYLRHKFPLRHFEF
jgi:Leucine-rich repeat (LRR) protein